MNHLEFYKFQAIARGIRGPEDVVRFAKQNGHVYENLVKKWLPENKNAKIVDLACGHGSLLYWLRSQGFSNILGVENSPEQVAHVDSVKLTVEREDVFEWLPKIPPETFDVMFAVDFIEHISKDHFMNLLQLSHSVLRPGGKIIFRYPNGDSPFVGLNLFNDITHVWTYTSNALSSLSQMHGFESIAFQDEGITGIQQHRWIKVPFARLVEIVMSGLLRMVSRERIQYWNSSIWACLQKAS